MLILPPGWEDQWFISAIANPRIPAPNQVHIICLYLAKLYTDVNSY